MYVLLLVFRFDFTDIYFSAMCLNLYFMLQVAVKTIKKNKIENEQDLVRIRREIQIMSSIQHPHITHIYEGILFQTFRNNCNLKLI